MSPEALYHSFQSQAVSQVSLHLSLWAEARRHPSEEPGWPTFATTSVGSPTKPGTPHDSGHSAPQRLAAALPPPVSPECSLTFVNLPGRASLLKGLGLPDSHNCAQLDLQGISSKRWVGGLLSSLCPLNPLAGRSFHSQQRCWVLTSGAKWYIHWPCGQVGLTLMGRLDTGVLGGDRDTGKAEDSS